MGVIGRIGAVALGTTTVAVAMETAVGIADGVVSIAVDIVDDIVPVAVDVTIAAKPEAVALATETAGAVGVVAGAGAAASCGVSLGPGVPWAIAL